MCAQTVLHYFCTKLLCIAQYTVDSSLTIMYLDTIAELNFTIPYNLQHSTFSLDNSSNKQFTTIVIKNTTGSV